MKRGFTLIELLVVIAIIAVLAVVVVLTLNPAELLRQSRDANRLSDLSTMKTALMYYLTDASAPNLASSSLGYSACYLSTLAGAGTTTAKCGVFAGTYSNGNSSTTSALYRLNNSLGWVPVNLSQISYGSPISALPIDPINNTSSYYAYAASTTGSSFYFEIDAFMESKKYNASGTADVVTTDGGDNNGTLEEGAKLTL